MHSKEIENYKKGLKLTKRQREILVGKLLGDGHLETKDRGRTYRLKIEHSIKQKEYVDWLYHEFKEWVRTRPQQKERYMNLRSVKGIYKKYWFNTLSSGSFRFYARQFYENRRKIVPKLIRKMLSPLALAVWYMDDGSIKSNAHRTILFNTHSFDKKNIKLLQDALMENFNIKTTVRKQKEGLQIYVLSESVDNLKNTIKKYIIPSMKYKLPKTW